MSGKPTVTVDLWLTLIAELDGTQKSQKRYESRAELAGDVLRDHGFALDNAALLAASQEISRLVTSDHDLGVDLQFEDRVAQMLGLVDESLAENIDSETLSEVCAAIDTAFLDSPPQFLPGAIDVLAHLAKMDLNVALISNTGLTSATAYRGWFEAAGVLGHFEELTFSNEIACAKPNPAIFSSTLEPMKALPERSLHIGDNLLTDVSGAAGIGMHTGWISGHDDRDPIVKPDFTLDSISELPPVVDRWLSTLA